MCDVLALVLTAFVDGHAGFAALFVGLTSSVVRYLFVFFSNRGQAKLRKSGKGEDDGGFVIDVAVVSPKFGCLVYRCHDALSCHEIQS